MLPFRNKLSYKQNLAASVLSELTTVCTLFSHPGMPFSRERWVVVAVSSFYFLKLKWRLATSNISIVPLRSLTAGLDRIVYVLPFLWNITALIQEIFSSFRAVRYSCKIPSPISASFPPYSYVFSRLTNISLDRTDQLKELNDSDFSVMPIPNIQPSAPISEPLSL